MTYPGPKNRQPGEGSSSSRQGCDYLHEPLKTVSINILLYDGSFLFPKPLKLRLVSSQNDSCRSYGKAPKGHLPTQRDVIQQFLLDVGILQDKSNDLLCVKLLLTAEHA